MKDKVTKVLDAIRPGLQMDGGDIELVSVGDDGVVRVKLVGACAGCPMSMMTLQMGVERALKREVPEVVRVENVTI
ncbi:MAG TPA: NifU family protein [Chloroflexota bacterium]